MNTPSSKRTHGAKASSTGVKNVTLAFAGICSLALAGCSKTPATGSNNQASTGEIIVRKPALPDFNRGTVETYEEYGQTSWSSLPKREGTLESRLDPAAHLDAHGKIIEGMTLNTPITSKVYLYRLSNGTIEIHQRILTDDGGVYCELTLTPVIGKEYFTATYTPNAVLGNAEKTAFKIVSLGFIDYYGKGFALQAEMNNFQLQENEKKLEDEWEDLIKNAPKEQ